LIAGFMQEKGRAHRRAFFYAGRLILCSQADGRHIY